MLKPNCGGIALIASLVISLAACGDLRVPSNNSPNRTAADIPCNRDQAGPGKVYVCNGDSLISLAYSENVTVANLMKVNRLTSPTIYAGTTLLLPDEYIYVVAEGDTLLDISRRTAVPTSTIIAANDLTNPDRLLPETRLAIPGRQTQVASWQSTPAAPVVASPNTAPPMVATLPPAAEASTSPRTLPARPSSVTIGAAPTVRPTEATTAPAPSVTAPSVQTPPPPAANLPAPRQRPATVANAPAAAKPSVVKPAAPKRQALPPGSPSFLLPVEGKILSDFGPKSGGLHNDGINIAAPRGTAIRASAAGKVAYAGDGLPGFGNLILIKHDDGWTSAYAHASSMAVKRGDSVRQGQTIGEIGSTGSVTEPQLHFELRNKDRAVDPTTLIR